MRAIVGSMTWGNAARVVHDFGERSCRSIQYNVNSPLITAVIVRDIQRHEHEACTVCDGGPRNFQYFSCRNAWPNDPRRHTRPRQKHPVQASLHRPDVLSSLLACKTTVCIVGVRQCSTAVQTSSEQFGRMTESACQII